MTPDPSNSPADLDRPIPVDAATMNRLASTGTRRLSPANCQIFQGTFSLLHCTVVGDQIYRGVFASLAFPVSQPDRFICLRYHDSDGKNKDIGVIEDLAVFDEPARQLIQQSLRKHYYEQRVLRVLKIQVRFGLLFIDVLTDRDSEPSSLSPAGGGKGEGISAGIGGRPEGKGSPGTRQQFTMRWQVDRAQDYGEHGKVLLDTFENRFVIHDLRQLPPRDRVRLQRYIYW